MMGTESNPGVNRCAIRELFALCAAAEESDFSLKVSMMEVYNEKLYDILAPTGASLDIQVGLGMCIEE